MRRRGGKNETTRKYRREKKNQTITLTSSPLVKQTTKSQRAEGPGSPDRDRTAKKNRVTNTSKSHVWQIAFHKKKGTCDVLRRVWSTPASLWTNQSNQQSLSTCGKKQFWGILCYTHIEGYQNLRTFACHTREDEREYINSTSTRLNQKTSRGRLRRHQQLVGSTSD
jgi:hypothetical protein